VPVPSVPSVDITAGVSLKHPDVPRPELAEHVRLSCEHKWVEFPNCRKTIKETIDANIEESEAARARSHRRGRVRGPLFENLAIESNKDKMGIQATKLILGCTKCGWIAEVDILGSTRLGEAKSLNVFDTAAKVEKQGPKLLSVHRQYFGTSTLPLAKLDESRPDHDKSGLLWITAGFDVEIVPFDDKNIV
jgi:hypothetical protein